MNSARLARRIAPIALLLAVAVLGEAVAQDVKKGGITVSAPWARATPGGAKVAGAYLEIRAEDGVEDRLVAASSPRSGTMELHDHVNDGGVMRMRRIEAISVTGSRAVVLKPGGLHLMLMELSGPLKEGETVEITLVFEKAGEIKVTAPIAPIGAAGVKSEAGSGSGHGSGSGSNTESGSGSGSGNDRKKH